jgi:lipoprotein-anchoring transpeptidase ErfK/SrfK
LFGEKWIDVDLTAQMVTAYEGSTPVFRMLASTGIWKYPTVVGTFNIYIKHEITRMTGGYGEEAYDLADVPYVMYFHHGYGFHGTYWHNNFGTPMSHGCVNLSIRDAEWLFNWAPVGTKVVSHY